MNDPVEIREERVVAGGGPVPASSVVPASPQPAGVSTGTYASRSGVYPVGYRAIQTVWFIVGLINVILAFDFVFRLLKANDAGFASAIYAVGGALAAPFDPIFGVSSFRGESGIGIIRWSDVLAVIVYSLVAWGISKVVRITNAPSDARTA